MITIQQKEFIKNNAFKLSNRKIARTLKINEKTVRNYKKKIFGYAVNHYKDFYRIKQELKPLKLPIKDLIYLAGFSDGEGSLFISRQHTYRKYLNYTPVFSITNTNKDIILWIKKVLVKGTVVSETRKDKNYKTQWQYSKQGFGLLPLLKILEPYLRLKKEHSRLLIKFIETRLNQKWKETYTKEQIDIYNQIKQLNKRGIK